MRMRNNILNGQKVPPGLTLFEAKRFLEAKKTVQGHDLLWKKEKGASHDFTRELRRIYK